MTKNAHLVYLTGISMDKKRLNYIIENINRDIDFSHWLDKVKKSLTQSINKNKSQIKKEL